MKNNSIYPFALVISVALWSCSSSNQSDNMIEEETDKVEKLAVAPDSWIQERTSKAEARLKSSEAGKLLWAAIEAHGGLTNWFSKGPISFHFDYRPLDGGMRRNSYQVVDQWSVRAVHEVAANRTVRYGWDGRQAWTFPDTANVGVNPRFWSTTPFYFIGLPFVLADEGVLLELLGQKEFDGVVYDLIKATYESGVGDAPDDFYVIYINPETKLMGGLRYIVSYPGFFPDGGHLPEKFMELKDFQTVDGITIPTGYNTHWFKEDQPAEHITTIDVTEVAFLPEILDSYFLMPPGSKVQEGY